MSFRNPIILMKHTHTFIGIHMFIGILKFFCRVFGNTFMVGSRPIVNQHSDFVDERISFILRAVLQQNW